MATFTITTATNIDSLASKTGGDTYNINGGTLTIDQDSRYGQNQTTSTTLGPITVSATLGGSVTFDGSLVRLIPYNTGTGNVPAANTTISQGSASGLLLGVYSALNVAPTAAGAAMPASGYVKIKQWNSVSYAAGALTGIGATATGNCVYGWIEVSADDSSTITLPRLGNSTLKIAQGAWYQIGTTDGNRNTTYQIPSHGLLQYHAGVFVETGTGTGVYEAYPVTGQTATAANVGTEAARGKYCWIATDGTLRFGHDGTNSTGGYVPPTGRKIVIGNVFFVCNTAAARTANVEPNATLGTRYKFVTTGGGVINIDKVSMNWFTQWTAAYSINLTNSGFLTTIQPTTILTNITIDRCVVGQHSGTAVAQGSLQGYGCLGGITVTNSHFGHSPSISNGYCLNLINCTNVTISDTQFSFTGVRTNTTAGSMLMSLVSTVSFTNCTFNSQLQLTNCSNLTFTDSVFYDPSGGTTLSTQAINGVLMNNVNNLLIDGWSHGGLVGVAPYSIYWRFAQSNNQNIRIRNIGSYASPLDCGGPEVADAAWTRSSTTITVTSTAHGLKTGDLINVPVSSDTSTISVGQRTVASTPDANTFTFTASASGAISGTLTYYYAITSNFIAYQNNSYSSDIKFQRVYMNHFRQVALAGANDNNKLRMENCVFDNEAGNSPTSTLAVSTITIRSALSVLARTAQSAVYGTIWTDWYISRHTSTQSAQAWTRSTTTATVTTTGHKLRTGDLINVTVTSDASAIVLGQKTVTVINSSTFTFTCLNAGAASGTISYTPLNGTIGLMMNESNTDTSSQITIDAGTPKFTSAGSVVMGTVNDQITWETPDYILGHLNFPVAEAVMAGGTISDYLITYAINTGSGYSSYKNLYRGVTGGSGSSSSTTITVSDTSNIAVGDYVFGTNVAPLAKVTSITNGTDFVVDKANTGTVSGTIRFNQLPNEADIGSGGVKLKIRIKTTNTNTNGITSLTLYSFSTTTERTRNYEIRDPRTLTLSGLQSGSDIVIRPYATPGTALVNVDANSGSTYGYTYYYTAGTYVDIQVYKAGYKVWEQTNYLLTDANATLFVAQTADLEYA